MMKNKNIFSKLVLIILTLISSSELLLASSGSAEQNLDSAVNFMIVLTILLIVLVLWLTFVYSEMNDHEGKLFLGLFNRIKNYSTKLQPIEEEYKILMDHDYDGIKELDNKVPPIFNLLFYGSILFGIIYMINYHVIGTGNVQYEEYMQELTVANEQKEILIKSGAFVNEETVNLLSDQASLQEGKDIFMKNCASCHASDGGGLVGPNLTDDYYLHGSGLKNIFKVIKEGVPQKGMISWESQLGPKKIQEVASFIITLQGTQPAQPKQPEGELIVPEENVEPKS